MSEQHLAHPALPTGMVTFLFTDIEGSTALWEQDGARMSQALAAHDALARGAVEGHRGTVVKMIGDGMQAVFNDAVDALAATLDLQHALADPVATHGVALRVRCGLHAGVVERRDNDFFGTPVNRAARIMAAAHGGQVLVSQAVAELIVGHLPDHVTLRDLGAVRLRDLASPEHVYQLLHPQLRKDFPTLRSLAATPNNLPQLATSFIARERELSEVRSLLEKTRLLTLCGTGGLGKTRLCLQLAADILDEFPDGVWLVELAPLSDERFVAQAIASVLGVKEEPGRPLPEALAKHVSDRTLLIIMDNCEHLVQACAELATRLLAAGPDLKILASSRENLRVAGERSYQVPALATPEAKGGIAFEDMPKYAAVRLFTERAGAAQSAFRMTPANATAVSDICRRLDGIPLAIELAAARVRALSVETIAERLGDHFRLLTHGDRTALPRQQTLRALIDWSHDLLTEPERVVFRRLAVFQGGWTLGAAEAVCSGSEVGKSDVMDLLTNLVEKSLVVLAADGERYRLLETTRAYALERLAEAGEIGDGMPGDGVDQSPLGKDSARAVARSAGSKPGNGAVRYQAERAHAAYYDSLLAQISRSVRDGDQDALRLAETELDNFRASVHWAMAHEDAGMVARGALVLLYFCDHRGRLEEGLTLMRNAQSSPAARAAPWLEAQLAASAAHLEYRLDRYPEAMATAQWAMAQAQRDTKVQAFKVLAACSLRLGRLDDAKSYYHEALRLSPESTDPNIAAGILDNLALVEKGLGNYDEALRLSLRSLAAHRQLRDAAGEALCLNNLGAYYIDRGEYETAGVHLREGLAIAERHGLVSSRGLILTNLTECALRSNDVGQAENYAMRALDVARGAGHRLMESWLLLQLTSMALRRVDAGRARQHLAAALDLAVAVASPSLQMAGVASFAEIVAAQGDADCARCILAFAERHPATTAAQAAEIRKQLSQLPPCESAPLAWPEIDLDELVHRIRSEAPVAHAPLIAALRGAS